MSLLRKHQTNSDSNLCANNVKFFGQWNCLGACHSSNKLRLAALPLHSFFHSSGRHLDLVAGDPRNGRYVPGKLGGLVCWSWTSRGYWQAHKDCKLFLPAGTPSSVHRKVVGHQSGPLSCVLIRDSFEFSQPKDENSSSPAALPHLSIPSHFLRLDPESD